MATGAYNAISSYDNTGTQSLAVTDKINEVDYSMSVFWNDNDNVKQLIYGVNTKQIPSSISTKDESWGGTQIFEVSQDIDALGNIYLSVLVDLDIPDTPLNNGPPETLTTLLRRPSTKESITLWDLTEPIMYRIRGIAKGSNLPEGSQVGYPNGWEEDTSAPNYPSKLNNIHPFMHPDDLPVYPEWDFKPREFLQIKNFPIPPTSRPSLSDFLKEDGYYGINIKEYLFNPDMRTNRHKLDLFNDREEYSLGDPRPMSFIMKGFYGDTLRSSPNYAGQDNFINDSLVQSSYQTTYRPHDLSYIPKYLSYNDSKKLIRTGKEHFNVNKDGTYSLYSSPGILADDFFISYLTFDDVVKLVDYYNDSTTTTLSKTPYPNQDPTVGYQGDEYMGLPGSQDGENSVAFFFGSQGGKSPLGWPHSVYNHTHGKGEKIFIDGEVYSLGIVRNIITPFEPKYRVGSNNNLYLIEDGSLIVSNVIIKEKDLLSKTGVGAKEVYSQTGGYIGDLIPNSEVSLPLPDNSYSITLDKIHPIADPEDLPQNIRHQEDDHNGYACVISGDGNTMVLSQGRMYGNRDGYQNFLSRNNLHATAESLEPETWNPQKKVDDVGLNPNSTYSNDWDNALKNGAALFPNTVYRRGKIRVYKKIEDNWVLNTVFEADKDKYLRFRQGSKSIKRPGIQEYIYFDPIHPKYSSGTHGSPIGPPIILQKTPWAPGCKHHIAVNHDGSRIVIGEAGGPNNAVSTYDYDGTNWKLKQYKISGPEAINNRAEDYYIKPGYVYTGNSSYTFNNHGVSAGIYPLPDDVWGSGFGNNVELSATGSILAVTRYKDSALVYQWNTENSEWIEYGVQPTGIADCISLTSDGQTLVTANFSTDLVHVWEFSFTARMWVNIQTLNLRFTNPTDINQLPYGSLSATQLELNNPNNIPVPSAAELEPGQGGDIINSKPVTISGDGSRIIIGEHNVVNTSGIGTGQSQTTGFSRLYGTPDTPVKEGILRIYTRVTSSNIQTQIDKRVNFNSTLADPAQNGIPTNINIGEWVQFIDEHGVYNEIPCGVGCSVSMSNNGSRIVVGLPNEDNNYTPDLPQFPPQSLLLGTQQAAIASEIPFCSSYEDAPIGDYSIQNQPSSIVPRSGVPQEGSSVSARRLVQVEKAQGLARTYGNPNDIFYITKGSKTKSGKLKVYEILNDTVTEIIDSINGESGEKNPGDSHSHVSSQNFHNIHLVGEQFNPNASDNMDVIYNSVRYQGDLSTSWDTKWSQYGGIDFISNYFLVNGGSENNERDINYPPEYYHLSYKESSGEGLGWSVSMSADGNTIVSGAPFMSTIGTTIAKPRRSYRNVGRSYVYNLKTVYNTTETIPKGDKLKKKMTYNDGFKLVNEVQKKLNHDITDFANLPNSSRDKVVYMNWKKQWDTVPDQAVNPPKLKDYNNPYWAKSNLKTKVNKPLSHIIKSVEFQYGTQVWQTLKTEDIQSIHATELSESSYNSLQLQCSGLVRSDGTRETHGDSKWIPGKKYQAIIPIPILSGNSKQLKNNYSNHSQESYLNFLSKPQKIKIRVEYANVDDIFDTSNVYAYQGYEAPIYTLYSSDQIGKYITNVPKLWEPKIKLSTALYGEYISLCDEEKTSLKNISNDEKIDKRVKSSQNIKFYNFPEIIHREMYIDIKLDTFSLYSSHFIISLDFPGIKDKNKIPYIKSAELFLNGITHSGKIPSSGLLMAGNSLGLYSNEFKCEYENLDKLYYVFPLASRAFGGSSLPLDRFDDIVLRLFFTVNGGIPDDGISIPEHSYVNITCRGETIIYYYNGGSSIKMY
tara:strand:- start:7235 stop:12622 length:5388 start_codon:yes stop_codon:yes gene_type:complete